MRDSGWGYAKRGWRGSREDGVGEDAFKCVNERWGGYKGIGVGEKAMEWVKREMELGKRAMEWVKRRWSGLRGDGVG